MHKDIVQCIYSDREVLCWCLLFSGKHKINCAFYLGGL